MDEGRARLWTAANVITLLRVLSVPIMVMALARHASRAAFWVFVAAACTDFLDGMAARGWHQRSKLGILLDPIADKILMTALFIALSLPAIGGPNIIPLALTGLVIGRDAAIALGAFIVFKKRGPRPFLPTLWGKISTFLQMGLIGLVLLLNMLGTRTPLLDWAYGLTFVSTLVSAVHYFVARFLPWMAAR
jgi:cardiolipin synthase